MELYTKVLETTKRTFKSKCKKKDTDTARWYLGMIKVDDKDGTNINQNQYIEMILQTFKIEDEKESLTQILENLILNSCHFPKVIINLNTVHIGKW